MLFNICDNYYEPTKYVLNNKQNDNEDKNKNVKNTKYILNIENEENEENECFICYENNSDKIIKLNNHCFYLKTCKCEGYIHKICLDTWLDTTNKCPICRNQIYKNTDVELNINHYNYFLFFIYFLWKKYYVNIIRFFLVIFFFYYTSEYYLYMIKYTFLLKNNFKNEYKFNQYNCSTTIFNKNIGINYIVPYNNVIIHPNCFD